MTPIEVHNAGEAAIVAIGYLAVVLGAGWLIGRFVRNLPRAESYTSRFGALDLPLVIGWLERFLP